MANEKTTAVLEAALKPILEAFENGIANPAAWKAPWHNSTADVWTPSCPATGRNYTAGNRFILAITSMIYGAEPHWGTYNQWKGMSKHSKACNDTVKNAGARNESRPDCGEGCATVNVRKGEKSVAYALRPLMKKEVDESGKEKTRIYGFAPFAVFHSGQVDGYDIPKSDVTPVAHIDDVLEAFEFARKAGAHVVESAFEGASYRPGSDTITMPAADRWTEGHGAWSTMAHELAHWTGHDSRLKRDLTGRFGDDSYAAEELVAELASAFTMSSLGRVAEPREDHVHYLAHWLRVLKADPKHLLTVASLAEKASGFVLEAAAARELVAA